MSDLDQLEARIDAERAKLSSTLDQLTATLAPEQIAMKLTSSVEDYGGELGRQAWKTAKQNPAAFALVAAGVGLLMTGAGSPRDVASRERYRANDPANAMYGFDDRVGAADAAIKADMATDSASPKSSWLRDRLESGLEALPSQARKRVVKARRAALAAQERVEARASDVARRTRSFHGQQPLAVGALAIGVGALIGALLPSTRQEDEFLGQRRDALMSKAESVLEIELAKLKGAVRDGVDVAVNGMTSSGRRAGTSSR